MFEICTAVIWAIIGAITLTMKEVPKLSYGLVWFMLMIELISNCEF